jgi:recombination protein RecA
MSPKNEEIKESDDSDEQLNRLSQLAEIASKVVGSDAVYDAESAEHGTPKGFTPTGIKELDDILDEESRGWPLGRFVEIYGLEGTGKSSFAYNFIAQCQKIGGLGVLIPAEGEYSEWLAKQYGVDQRKLLIVETNIVEEMFETIHQMLEGNGRDNPLVIVVDSIAGLCTRKEFQEKSYSHDMQAQIRAQLLSKGLRKLGTKIPLTTTTVFFINQVNEGEVLFNGIKCKPKPVGGKRVGFYSSIRLRLENEGKFTRTKNKNKYTAGFYVKATTDKNRLCKPFQTVHLVVDFEKGLYAKT